MLLIIEKQFLNLRETKPDKIMQVQFNTDKTIEGHERMQNHFSAEIKEKLKRFDDKITRLEIHVGDENSEKFGLDDKKCVIEAGMNPMVVTHNADTVEKAFSGASDKIKKVLDTTFDKMKSH